MRIVEFFFENTREYAKGQGAAIDMPASCRSYPKKNKNKKANKYFQTHPLIYLHVPVVFKVCAILEDAVMYMGNVPHRKPEHPASKIEVYIDLY